MIAVNLKSVTQRIARCCKEIGASPEDIVLVCIAKEASVEQVHEIIGLGQRIIGENRVQDALAKHKAIGESVTWHMVGHLQTNKVKDAVRIFSLIHSVDSIRLAQEIDGQARKIGKQQDILIQVNTSGEMSKFGVKPEEAVNLIKEAASYDNISIKGLMTIAPEVIDPETVRPHFRALRELKDKINDLRPMSYDLKVLSMGMSNDFEAAIREGSNMVRLGRAIFAE